MSAKDDRLYLMIRDASHARGFENTIQTYLEMGFIDAEQAEAFRIRNQTGKEKIAKGGPIFKRGQEGWYDGADPSDPSWGYFSEKMQSEGKDIELATAHEASDMIVNLTPDPSTKDPFSSKGLVVGFVQSGKTTNFTAVAAKLADCDYRMVIVLAGIHNALRSQTQSRLQKYLIPDEDGRWFTITSKQNDFDLVKLNKERNERDFGIKASQLLSAEGRTSLLVVKKNATVLRKLIQWLSKDAAKALTQSKVLVIDDEADQASVETATINPLIREMLGLFSQSSYIGYTATPFANVFIDPNASDDLYPRDFIYPMPRPEGYFGPEMLFGRDVLNGDGEGDIDGYDMIRRIPEENEFLYRPQTTEEVNSFIPVVEEDLRAALRWFLLATAARWARREERASDKPINSSMLIHTSFNTQVHNSYADPLREEVEIVAKGVKSEDPDLLNQLERLWLEETSRVPAGDWERESESFETILKYLPAVIEDCRVVIDNYSSPHRLSYDEDIDNTVIAVGGNTLSRGITLEGLVSSFFIRPTNTYDTLLQMGRWFGFRTGYEDLPRLWTTDQLRRSFRHLALVEHEMRLDMDVYEKQSLSPTDFAVRIRTHPSLRVTAKMGAAQPARISFSGARIQLRMYERSDEQVLESNWRAGIELVQSAERSSKPERLGNGSVLYRNVPVGRILQFLNSYEIIPDQTDVEVDLIRKYIDERRSADNPQLNSWNIAVRAGDNDEIDFAGHKIKLVNRAPIGDESSPLTRVADIGTLMVPQDLVIDVPDLAPNVRKQGEAGMKLIRSNTEELKDKGLIVLYPIDKNSTYKVKGKTGRLPMEAPHHLLGVAFVFPRANMSESERASVQTTHMAVELADHAEVVDTSAAMAKD